MLASTLGIEFDLNQGWDEKEAIFKVSGKIVKTTDITQSAVVDKNGMWTSVLAAAVFILSNHENEKPPLSVEKPANGEKMAPHGAVSEKQPAADRQ